MKKYTLNDYRQHKDYEAILKEKGTNSFEFEKKDESEQFEHLVQWFKEEKKRITKPRNKRIKTVSELQNELMYDSKLSDSEKVKRWMELDSIKKKEKEIEDKEEILYKEKNELEKLKQKYDL